MTDVPFRCACGQIHGRLTAIEPGAGLRVVCHCRDCRAAEVALGQPDPQDAGVDLFQTTPDRVVIDGGAEHLALLRLSPRGLFRWHAACCGTPLFNTAPKRGVPFASLHVNRASDPTPLGPVRAEVNGKKNRGLLPAVAGIFTRLASARLSGRWRQTPFFDGDGTPVAAPRILSLDERRAVTPAA